MNYTNAVWKQTGTRTFFFFYLHRYGNRPRFAFRLFRADRKRRRDARHDARRLRENHRSSKRSDGLRIAVKLQRPNVLHETGRSDPQTLETIRCNCRSENRLRSIVVSRPRINSNLTDILHDSSASSALFPGSR